MSLADKMAVLPIEVLLSLHHQRKQVLCIFYSWAWFTQVASRWFTSTLEQTLQTHPPLPWPNESDTPAGASKHLPRGELHIRRRLVRQRGTPLSITVVATRPAALSSWMSVNLSDTLWARETNYQATRLPVENQDSCLTVNSPVPTSRREGLCLF